MLEFKFPSKKAFRSIGSFFVVHKGAWLFPNKKSVDTSKISARLLIVFKGGSLVPRS